jgi:uncharacterized protein (DUF885 family)
MSEMFQIADQLVDAACANDPVLCTFLGVPGSDHLWGDGFGLAGVEAEQRIRTEYRPKVEPFLEAPDLADRIAARVILAAHREGDEADEAGDHFYDLNHLASSFQTFRRVFDVMSTDTSEAVDAIASRLETLEQPLTDYRDMLADGKARGAVVASRQVRSVIEQARHMAERPESLGAIVEKVETGGHGSDRIRTGVETARAAFADFGDWLEGEYLPAAVDEDAVGRERYQRAANRVVGLRVDPDEAYEWGWEGFGRLLAELERVAEQISSGDGVAEVTKRLETDRSETVRGTDSLLAFVEEVLAKAVEELAGRHFDVPDLIRPLTVQLAPPGSPLGVYYMRPSEDFTRPGGVWYSIGDQQVFPLYQHVSTAYHEGFPGHHLQIATAMSRSEEISRFQRVMTWYPGYGEGWGMYAEVLMGELGFLDDPRHYFGMLAKQMYRTARVVVDIGLHLEKEIPEESPMFGGEPWSFDRAVDFMEVYGFRTREQARDEVLRYLGWPGQAIAYKLGEREILDIRSETRQRLGEGFDLTAFHSTVLNHGAMRLDLLRELVRERLAT